MRYDSLEAIEKRRSEIEELLYSEAGKKLTKEDLDKIDEEMNEMRSQKKQLQQAAEQATETRKKAVEAVLGGAGTKADWFKQPEERSNKPMDIIEKRSTPEYREAFVKTLQGSATVEQRALVTIATGAAVIPTTTFNEVIENVQKAQGVLSKVRILQVPGKLSIPTSDINTPAAWHVEGDEILDSNLPPTNLTLTGYELAKLFSMSAATKAMSVPAFENYLTQELIRTNSDALSQAFFTGSGLGQPSGLGTLTWDVTNSITTVKGVEYAELVSALALLASNFRQSAAFIMNSTTYYTYVTTISDSNGNPIFVKDMSAAGSLSILGKEVIIDDFCPDNTIYIGNPKYYFYNFSAPLSIEASSEAGFTKGVTMYRSMAVVDGKPLPSGAFVKITVTP